MRRTKRSRSSGRRRKARRSQEKEEEEDEQDEQEEEQEEQAEQEKPEDKIEHIDELDAFCLANNITYTATLVHRLGDMRPIGRMQDWGQQLDIQISCDKHGRGKCKAHFT